MSEYRVPVTTIKEVLPHPNADRLEIAKVYDFSIVVQKDKYKPNDKILFIPIDSVLPAWLEKELFNEDSKIKLHNSRVKQIKIRSQYSQGLIVDLTDANVAFNASLEEDYAEVLGIKKYEPPAPEYQREINGRKSPKKANPLFYQYEGIDNMKWLPDLFKEGEEVVLQEKIHGSLCRIGYLPYNTSTLWQRFKKWLFKLSDYEIVIGTNRTQITGKRSWTGYYDNDIYTESLMKCNAPDKIKPGEIIYGEVIGPKIQANYTYGKTEPYFVMFDVRVLNEDKLTFRWLNPEEVEQYAKERGFDIVPTLYKGPFNKDKAYELTKGDSVYCPEQKVREGVVVKSRYAFHDLSCHADKKVLKIISEKYLEGNQTDFH